MCGKTIIGIVLSFVLLDSYNKYRVLHIMGMAVPLYQSACESCA